MFKIGYPSAIDPSGVCLLRSIGHAFRLCGSSTSKMSFKISEIDSAVKLKHFMSKRVVWFISIIWYISLIFALTRDVEAIERTKNRDSMNSSKHYLYYTCYLQVLHKTLLGYDSVFHWRSILVKKIPFYTKFSIWNRL